MSYWDYREKKAVRNDAYRLLRLERGIDARTLILKAVTSWDPRFFVALLIISLFAWVLAQNVGDDTLKGALIAAFAGAWGYYLGSSSNAAKAGDRIDKQIDLNTKMIDRLPTPPPSDDGIIELEPGEEKLVTGVEPGMSGTAGGPTPPKPDKPKTGE